MKYKIPIMKIIKMMIKEIKEDLNTWRNIPSSQIGRINIVKKLSLSKLIGRFKIIPINTKLNYSNKILQRKV